MRAAICLRTRRLWMCIAKHLAWNDFVPQLFSTTVSGHQRKPASCAAHWPGRIC
jgi:hypothetical protein